MRNGSIALGAIAAGLLAALASDAQPVADIRSYGAACDGQTDDSRAFAAALAAQGKAVVPPGAGPCVANEVTVHAGEVVRGPGHVKAAKGATEAFVLIGGAVENLALDANGATYAIRSLNDKSPGGVHNAVGPAVRHVRFSGSARVYLVFACDNQGGTTINPVSDGNSFDGSGASVGAGTMWEGCENFASRANTYVDIAGFPEQTLWSTGAIEHLRTHAPDFGGTQIAAGGQASFVFQAREGCSRFGLTTGLPPAAHFLGGGPYSVSQSGTTYTIATPPQAAGTPIAFHCFRQFEGINVNAGSGRYYGPTAVAVPGSTLRVADAEIDGAGDAGIAVGCDYHWTGSAWIPADRCESTADLPGNVQIAGLVTKNTLLGGVVGFGTVLGLSVSNYTISNYGLERGSPGQEPLSSAIVVVYPRRVGRAATTRIGPGTIDNSLGTGLYGISVNGGRQVENGTVAVATPTYRGIFRRRYNFIDN